MPKGLGVGDRGVQGGLRVTAVWKLGVAFVS